MKTNHDPEPGELELPHRPDLIEQVCERRIYPPSLFSALMTDRVMSVTVNSEKSKGMVRMRFLFGDKVAQECTLDTASMIAMGVAAGTEWVWQGPREGGVCLIIAHPVELLEITALDPRLINQIGLVIAAVPVGEVPGLISGMVIKDTLLVGTSCYGAAATNIRIRAKINGVKLFAASPDPYPDWAQLRDVHTTGDDPLTNQAIQRLRKSVSHLLAHHLKTNRIGGIEIKLPRY